MTGTSGKTSVAAFTRQIWQRLGHASASIGTIGLVSPKRTVYGSLTTPDPIALHRQLDEIARDGVTHLAFEASSHGLDQYRLDGVRIAAGGFTNLSRDHMDYHPDVAHYLAAKLRLFRDLVAAGGAAVISADHDCSAEVIEAARSRELADHHGRRARPMARARAFAWSKPRSKALRRSSRSSIAGATCTIRLPLVGEFQIENALVAAGLAIGTGSEADAVFASLEHLEGAKGRLERVGERNGAPIFVDYAHKPDALAKALQALRPYAKRKLVVIFGAGGDRDAGKRPLMGAIAAENADQRHRHRRQSAQREAGSDPRRDSGCCEGCERDRRPCRGDSRRHRGVAAGRCVADRRQGPRDRTDRRRQDAAVQRSRGGGGRIGSEGRMSAAPLWTSAAMAEAMRAQVEGALPEAITGLSIDSRTHRPGRGLFRDQGRRPRRA